ncbi:MAG TPA: rhodanese-like domain-containing protein [Paludibacter sp.]|nr:rhodanese-like domain-containing protein [Paludibacter sp.]
MKKLNLFKLALLSFTFSIIGFTSCVDPIEEPEVDHYKILTTYLKANSLDLNNMTTTWVIDAPTLNTAGVTNSYIIDIRSAADFAIGHIEGAVNSTLANVVTTAQNAGTKPIVIACYTGQNAAVALVALRLNKISNCKILKWGMSGWNVKFDSWTANISNQGKGHANWSTTNTIKTPVVFALPKITDATLTAADTTGALILAKRITYMLSQGFRGINASDVLASPTSYFINNYWTDADVTKYGHIAGAYRLNETLTLAADGMKNLDASKTVVTYCWTGQTSALVSAYLTVLGYDAKGIKFGTNAMINADLMANKWTTSGNFPYVTN